MAALVLGCLGPLLDLFRLPDYQDHRLPLFLDRNLIVDVHNRFLEDGEEILIPMAETGIDNLREQVFTFEAQLGAEEYVHGVVPMVAVEVGLQGHVFYIIIVMRKAYDPIIL